MTDEPRSYKHKGRDHIIPPQALFVAEAKDGRVRSVPLNNPAEAILRILCEDVTVTRWLFVNREGKPLGSFKRGWQRACERAGIDNLRPYDLRGTFATRLVERYVPMDPIISSLLGHTRSSEGFGHASRITPGYTQATWEAMVRAVESLEYSPEEITVFGRRSDKSRTNGFEQRVEEERVAVAS